LGLKTVKNDVKLTQQKKKHGLRHLNSKSESRKQKQNELKKETFYQNKKNMGG
jgi:hypothetical protein